jgi:aspartate carbamoyltransferase catalytic subunit
VRRRGGGGTGRLVATAPGFELPTRPFRHKHLLGIDGLSREDILQLLDAADALAPLTRSERPKEASLRGRTVVNLFFEASTRTRTSFEIAAKRLGSDAVNVTSAGSSVIKGETLLDTVRNLDAMRVDALVIRHPASGAPHLVARVLDDAGSKCAVINAGDGLHEHPTQALLDARTIREATGRRDDFSGLVVAIAGDVLHSRVARSNAILLSMLGAEVRLCAPATLLPPAVETLKPKDAQGSVRAVSRLEEALEGADVAMMLRVQRERLAGVFLSSTREYARTFGLSAKRLALAKPGAIVLHPGPINRGVELEDGVANGAQARILDQVENGVAVRMAVLHLLAGLRA